MTQTPDLIKLHHRLSRIVGQVQAVDRMISDENASVEDILGQIHAAKSALHGCGKFVLEHHIKECVVEGIQDGDADKAIENFTVAIDRFANMSD